MRWWERRGGNCVCVFVYYLFFCNDEGGVGSEAFFFFGLGSIDGIDGVSGMVVRFID